MNRSSCLVLSNNFYQNVCNCCGTIFVCGYTCTVWIWKRNLLRVARRSGKLAKEKWIKASDYIRKSEEARKEEGKAGKYVLVYRCDHCRAHTIFDSYSFDDVKFNPPPVTTKPDSNPIQPAKTDVKKNLHKYLQKKMNQPGAPSGQKNASDLNSFLLNLTKK